MEILASGVRIFYTPSIWIYSWLNKIQNVAFYPFPSMSCSHEKRFWSVRLWKRGYSLATLSSLNLKKLRERLQIIKQQIIMGKVSLWYLGISYIKTYSCSDNSVPSVVTCQHIYQKYDLASAVKLPIGSLHSRSCKMRKINGFCEG